MVRFATLSAALCLAVLISSSVEATAQSERSDDAPAPRTISELSALCAQSARQGFANSLFVPSGEASFIREGIATRGEELAVLPVRHARVGRLESDIVTRRVSIPRGTPLYYASFARGLSPSSERMGAWCGPVVERGSTVGYCLFSEDDTRIARFTGHQAPWVPLQLPARLPRLNERIVVRDDPSAADAWPSFEVVFVYEGLDENYVSIREYIRVDGGLVPARSFASRRATDGSADLCLVGGAIRFQPSGAIEMRVSTVLPIPPTSR
jgi:hypothetical protein